jgi:hypothetical protein
MYETVAKDNKKLFLELTATGIVPDLHRIPFSFQIRNTMDHEKPNAAQKYIKILSSLMFL